MAPVTTHSLPGHPGESRLICSMFGLPIDRITTGQVMDRVESYVKSGKPHQILYLNAHCINRSFDDDEYRAIIKQSDLVYADGMGVVWASHLTHHPIPERVNIGDFLIPFCRWCYEKGYSVYFLGSESDIARRCVEMIQEQVPDLKVAGIRNGYFTPEEEKDIIKDIQEKRPEILLVGMGVPQQEKWLREHLQELNVPVAWGVGALFEYYAGKVSRAPYWMRSNGLEWLYRLILEPGRMWKRYLIGNILFIMRVIALVFIDIIAATSAWFAAYGLRYSLSDWMGPINDLKPYVIAFPVIVLLWIFCSAWFGLYHRKKPLNEYQETYAILKASFLGLMISASAAFLMKGLDLGRTVVVTAAVLNFVFMMASRKMTSLFEIKNK